MFKLLLQKAEEPEIKLPTSSENESQCCSVVSNSLQHHGLYSPWNYPGQNTGLGSLFLLQGIFPTQGWNPGLPHCWRILYQLSHKESPWILAWVAYPFSRGSFWPRNLTGVSCIAGRFFTNWAISEDQTSGSSKKQESSRKTSTSALLTMPKPLTV